MTGPGVVADISPAGPAPVGSLVLSAASPPSNLASDEHWGGGIRYTGELCDVGELHDPCDSEVSAVNTLPDEIQFMPYAVEVGFKCSTGGFQSADYQEKARAALIKNQSRLIEHELWTGTKATAEGAPFDVNAFLASGTDVTTLGDIRGGAAGDTTSYDIVSAFGGLEHETRAILGGARAMLHVPDLLLAYLVSLHLVKREGNLLTTELGSIVVSGVGYPGTAPLGTAATATSMWAYGTGIVTLWLGDIVVSPSELSQAVSPGVNDVEFRASRYAATTFDTCGIVGARFDTTDVVGIYG